MATRAAQLPGTGRVVGVRRAGTRARYLFEVTVHLARRDFAARHRDSLLGWFWALAPPLLQLLVSYFLFTRVIPLRVHDYPVFLLIGILSWTWFSRSVVMGASSLEQGRSLVLRPGFPSAILPVKETLVALLDYLIALPVIVVALVATAHVHAAIAVLPVLVVIQLILVLGLVWIVAPLQAFFRDVQHLVGVLTMVGFWVTPIFYAPASVPSRFSLVYDLNPMAHLIEWQRGALLDGTLPSLRGLVVVAGASIVVAVVGFAVFASLRDRVPEQL